MSLGKSVQDPACRWFLLGSVVGLDMHYYRFNIGDYRSHTSHLDPIEDLAYRRLLDWCYLHERPLPDDIDQIARLISLRSHSDCIASVLREFFVLTPDGWWQSRIGEEIAVLGEKSKKASASARARWDKEKSDANALPADSERNATQNTEHITQNTDKKDAYASKSGTAFPPCPQQEILNLYGKHLPHLAQPRVWEGNRAAMLKQRWVQAAKPSAYSPEGYKTKDAGLAWWDAFFAYIANDTKLSAGFESNGRSWRPDLVWIVTAGNFAKIIDGKYAK